MLLKNDFRNRSTMISWFCFTNNFRNQTIKSSLSRLTDDFEILSTALLSFSNDSTESAAIALLWYLKWVCDDRSIPLKHWFKKSEYLEKCEPYFQWLEIDRLGFLDFFQPLIFKSVDSWFLKLEIRESWNSQDQRF